MLLLAALSAAIATLAVVVQAAHLSELKTNKNESEVLVNALRNKLMSENYDYMPPQSGEPARSAASYEEQEPTAVNTRARDVSGTREQYKDQKQESSKYIPETDDGPEDNLVEIQRPLPVPGDIEDVSNVMMRHDNPKLGRNRGYDTGKNNIASHLDGKIKMKSDEYNERDERHLDKGTDKFDTLKQSQNGDKRAKSQYNDPRDDNPPKRKDRNDHFKHIDQEPDKPAKLIGDTENDQIDKDAEMRRDKIDKYKYDNQRLDRTDDRQMTFDNIEKTHGNQERPGKHRYDEVSKLKNSKTSGFFQSNRDKRIDIRFGKSVDPRYNDLEALKAAKREQDEINNLRFDKSDHRRPDNLIHDKKDNFRQEEREESQLNSHENDRLHDLSGDNLENIKSHEKNSNRPYKLRFQKLKNVRPDDLRQKYSDKLTRDKMRKEKSDNFKYDKHDNIREEYVNKNKNNQLNKDEKHGDKRHDKQSKLNKYYDLDNKNKYNQLNKDEKHGDNRHEKRNKPNQYDGDVFPQTNDKSSKSNLKLNKYDGLNQDDLRYEKIRHTKRDEMRNDEMRKDESRKVDIRKDELREEEMKYEKADKRDDFRHKNPDEIRDYDKKKRMLQVTIAKEKKNKHELYVNHNKQDKSYHKEEIKKMGREHNQIKEKKMRQDYGVDDEYNKIEDNNRQSSKQKLEKPRDKPNENPRDQPRGLMHSKLNTKLKEVPLKYDKLEQQLEKQFQRITPITESDKENNKYKNNYKKGDQYIKDKYDKYKHINNEYKYKHKQFTENDKNQRYRSNNRYNKGRPYRPQQRARVVTTHPSEEYISEHGNVKYASATNSINSVYVPRSQDISNNINVTADSVSSDENFEQKEPGVSRRDLLYYVDDKKMAGLMGTEDVVDVADVPTVDTRRNAKKYKMLKMVTSGRRGGGEEGAGRVVQEEGAGGVALVALDGGALPSFQLPRARRQYMPSDHDSEYQAGDLLDDIPGLNEYPELNLARMDLSQLSPPGLTARVQDSFDQLYSPSVDGPITPDKEVGHGTAIFDAMNVHSILNE